MVPTSRTIAAPRSPDVIAVRGDIADPTTAERIVPSGVRRFCRIDTLVNNAGVFLAKPFTDCTPEDFASVIGVDVSGFSHLTRSVVRHMLGRGGGHIVTLTSGLVDIADARVPSVLTSLTKGGRHSATKAVAIEYATWGIRVNAVSPGVIRTPMHRAEEPEA